MTSTAPALHREFPKPSQSDVDETSIAPEIFWSEDAEQGVLSAMLMDSAAVTEARALLGPHSFYKRGDGILFATIIRLTDEKVAVDPITLSDRLLAQGELGAAGGKDYIGFLMDAVPTAANVKYHAQIVRDHALRRKLVELGNAVTSQLGTGARVDDVRVRLQEQLSELQMSASGLKLYDINDLASLPKVPDIIAGAIPSNSLVGLIGGKGKMKTFVALGIAFDVAVGLDWQGRRVVPGGVVYVYAEGPSGAEQRVEALIKYHEYLGLTIDRDNLPLWFVPGSVSMNNPGAVAALAAAIKKLSVPIVLVIVDTLNRNLEGKEDDQGMGDFVRGCSRLQGDLGVTVMPVHHTPLGDSERARGHSSFDGALDTRLMVTRDEDVVSVECTHQRNGVDGWSVAFQVVPFAGSVVLKPSALDAGELRGQRREILEVLHQKGTSKYGTWLKESGLTASSFRKARKWLLSRAYINISDSNYTVTDTGRLALGAPRAPEGHNA